MANQIIEDIKMQFRSGNPLTRLILINVSIFLLLGLFIIVFFLTGDKAPVDSTKEIMYKFLALPMSDFFQKPWTIFTYMFTQIGLGHIFWNMITLFWFGQILSEYTNPRKIIPLYILGGIAGAVFTLVLVNYIPQFQIYRGDYMIGASAGVTAIIVAAATLVPNYRMNLLLLGSVKLIYVAIFVVFINVLDVASYSNVGGNLAHLGGALMGFVFIWQYKKGNDWARPFNRFFDLFKKGSGSKMRVVNRKKVSDEEYNYNKAATQQMVDAILDKISRSGYESLTKAEKEILFKASKK